MLQYTVVENTVVKYNKNREEYYTIPMYSTNAIEIKFILDDSWKEYIITAQISNGEKTYNLLLQNNTAFIPADIIAGIWNVSIFGVKGEEKRNTTIPSDFCVVEEGFKSDGQPPIPPEPDLYQKLLAEIQKGIGIAQSVKNDADAGKFNGEDGNGIEKIELLSKVDKTATYKITFTDGSTFEYQVLDGQNGINGVNGVNGVDGITPTIGENGNWFIGDVDTGKPARGEKGEQGEQGLQGIQGVAGQDGKDGTIPDISINATVNNTVGTPSVSIEKTGTLENPVFNLSFENLKGEQGLQGERGEQGVAGANGTDGKSATITIGTVTTVSPDTPASVTNTGTSTDAIFNFEIPKGQDGTGGSADLDTLEKVAIKTFIDGNPAMSNSSAGWRVPLIEGYGQSTQGADPTPEYPQEIKSSVVTGVKVTGKNLFGLNNKFSLNLEKGTDDEGLIEVKGNKLIINFLNTIDYAHGSKFYCLKNKEMVFMCHAKYPAGAKIQISIYNEIGSILDTKIFSEENIKLQFKAQKNYIFIGFQSITQIGVELSELSLEESSNNVEYEPYKEQSIALSTPVTLRGIPSESGNVTIDGTKYLSDIIDKEKITRYIGYIESYNGEDVGDLYMSMTGQLTTGATVIYALSEPITEPLPAEDAQALADLKTFYPTSIISWETEDNSGVWTRAEIIHDPTNYIDEKLAEITAQQTALQAEILKIGGSI